MRRSHSLTLVAALGLLPICAAAQAPADLDGLLRHVGARLEQYYRRAQNIICTEKVTAQPIGSDMSYEGFARVLEYELHVESEAAEDGDATADAKVVRELRKVNGRAPRPKDKRGCLDPNPLSPEPLVFLLPGHREGYTFALTGYGKGKDRNALVIEFTKRETGQPEFIEDPEKRPECFQLSLPVTMKGRVWVDPDTFDVLRVEERLASRVDFPVPFDKQRRHNLPASLVIDRYDSVIRYKPVVFLDPAETVLLPESIELLAVLHGAQSHRKHQVFSDYRRFVTGARIVK